MGVLGVACPCVSPPPPPPNRNDNEDNEGIEEEGSAVFEGVVEGEGAFEA